MMGTGVFAYQLSYLTYLGRNVIPSNQTQRQTMYVLAMMIFVIHVLHPYCGVTTFSAFGPREKKLGINHLPGSPRYHRVDNRGLTRREKTSGQ